MNKAVPALIMASLLASAASQAQEKPAARPDGAKEQELIAHERALQEAVAKGDKSSFAALVISNGFWATPTSDGFIPLKLLGDGLEHFHLTKWEIVNPRVTWLDADSAIVSGAWTESGTFWDRPVSPVTVATTVWTKRDGKWLAVTHQETEVTHLDRR